MQNLATSFIIIIIIKSYNIFIKIQKLSPFFFLAILNDKVTIVFVYIFVACKNVYIYNILFLKKATNFINFTLNFYKKS